MQAFIKKHSPFITGILSGFDRLVFRGFLRSLNYPGGMHAYLSRTNVSFNDFANHVKLVTTQVKEGAIAPAEKYKRPLIYVPSSETSKADLAKSIMHRDGIKNGLICIFKAVEPCTSVDLHRNRREKKVELIFRRRKCLHVYQYWIHSILGFMNARIQTWFPFTVQICINGREWLAKQMDKARVSYVQQDNCFSEISDIKKAQRLMDNQLKTNWASLLGGIASVLNPRHREIFKKFPTDYYWTTYQSEWATDILFSDTKYLYNLYQDLIHHGMTTFQSPDVMRFLGRKVTATGQIPLTCTDNITSDIKRRHEGVRIKHRCGRNGVKIYNKYLNLLRVEATVNDPTDFKVFRSKQGEHASKKSWLPMRKSTADLYRLAEVSQATNSRYLEALAIVNVETKLKDLVKQILKPTTVKNRRVRAINPWSEDDSALLESVMQGAFTINGFRNRDLRPILFGQAQDSKERKRQSARVSRKLRMLRAHGLIKKVPHTHRYHVTEKGRTIIAALMAARSANTNQLTKLAA